MDLHSGFVALSKRSFSIDARRRVVSADEDTVVMMCDQLEPLIFAGSARERNELLTCKDAVPAAIEHNVLGE